ncbi:MAG: hypothetical protein KBA03_00425 [Anaerolineaceae bacterium]|nr:hypothetical protein [Anaerolineaceae bacterium]
MRTWKIILLSTLLIFLAGCAPKPEQVMPFVEQTLTALPTQTNYPTNTPYSTYTPYPTNTPHVITKVVTATRTLTPTLTPTQTFTPTPINSPTPTTPPTATFTTWQLTSEAVKATNDFFAQYSYVNQKDFLTYPEKLKDEKIKIQCRVFNVVSTKDIQCYISGTYDAFYVNMKNSFDNLYEDDRITIYGIGDGEHCFTNRMGNLTCQPLLSDAFFTKP